MIFTKGTAAVLVSLASFPIVLAQTTTASTQLICSGCRTYRVGRQNTGSRIRGGVYENKYTFKGGTWNLSPLHYYPLHARLYIGGWRNIGSSLPIASYHFTPDEAKIPIPQPAGNAPNTTISISQLKRRIASLDNEEVIRNLQNAYGYYVDRHMWLDLISLTQTNPPLPLVSKLAAPEISRAQQAYSQQCSAWVPRS
ncbi:hypothetical protein BGZ57DRAFT_859086 [Hyaloscypha finlandica]|nr:hypothetical protein BGZ57DRAFT_859086 [Hyaloscypha finlandica]